MSIFGKIKKTTTYDRGNRTETRHLENGRVKRIVDTSKRDGKQTERHVARNIFGVHAGKPKK